MSFKKGILSIQDVNQVLAAAGSMTLEQILAQASQNQTTRKAEATAKVTSAEMLISKANHDYEEEVKAARLRLAKATMMANEEKATGEATLRVSAAVAASIAKLSDTTKPTATKA